MLMLLENMLRRLSVGKRAYIAAIMVLLPMTLLLVSTVLLLQREDEALQQVIDESVTIMLPMSTLEYQLQRALNDELLAQTSQSVPGFSDLTHSVDYAFSTLEAAGNSPELPIEAIDAAQRAWVAARPGVARLIEQVGLSTWQGKVSESTQVRTDLERAIQEVEQARQQLSKAVKARYASVLAAQRSQLHRLLWGWGIMLLISALVIAAVVYSILKPMRRLGQAVQRFTQGADNFHVDTLGRDELTVIAAYFNEMVSRVQITHSVLEAKAYRDELTNLPNRSAILELLEDALNMAVETNEAVSVLIIDVDKFKEINDRFGHAAGDEALSWLAAEMRNILRKSDFLGRYGGDEFLAVLPNSSREQSAEVAERLCSQVRRAVANDEKKPGISIGVATTVDVSGGSRHLLEEADRALYRAKKSGRGRVVAASTLPTDG